MFRDCCILDFGLQFRGDSIPRPGGQEGNAFGLNRSSKPPTIFSPYFTVLLTSFGGITRPDASFVCVSFSRHSTIRIRRPRPRLTRPPSGRVYSPVNLVPVINEDPFPLFSVSMGTIRRWTFVMGTTIGGFKAWAPPRWI